MGHLSAIVASVAVVPATASWSLRKRRPLSAAVLAHVALSGFCVAIAASEHFAVHTHAMLGKVRQDQRPGLKVLVASESARAQRTTGSISPIGILLFWPYHVSLRSKLWVQRHFLDREPVFNAITDGWVRCGSSSAWQPGAAPARQCTHIAAPAVPGRLASLAAAAPSAWR